MKEVISDLLAKHRRNKAEAKAINLDFVQLAVSIGMPQEEALKTNLSVFFDGYLMAMGHMPAYRKEQLNG
jgi:hypothetical protein